MAVEYNQHTWGYGEELTPDKLNNIEGGVKATAEAVNEVNNNLNKRILYGHVESSTSDKETYRISPAIVDRGILCIGRTSLGLIKLSQSGGVFAYVDALKIAGEATFEAQLSNDKKDVIITTSKYENLIFIGDFR